MKDKILKIVEAKGPVLPATISKECHIDSLMAAAYLAELVSNKKIILSHLKVGGSPVYYIESQKARLQDYKNNLNEKDLKTVELLQKEKVVRDSELSPLIRVSVRTIKDFAIPLKVNKKEIFWKWYLISNEEALKLIKQKLSKKTQKKQEKTAEKKVDEEIKLKEIEKKQEVEQRSETLKRQKEEIEKVEKKKLQEIQKREKELEKKELELMEKIKQENDKLNEFKKKEKEFEEREKKLMDKLKREKEKLEQQLREKEEELRKRIIEEQREEQVEVIEERDEFMETVQAFCDANNITIEEKEIIKKNKEVDMTVSLPTPVGTIRYFCRAKDKKKCNDGDLSSAYLKGQGVVLPTLFLTTGSLTKRAEEMIGKEFKQMVVKKIENGSADN
ncbi:hypothetical protein KY312_03590 [Candidatus Woesearchaeota archaeon]|nr:hypothetical protein [Candidatus Woesearchaeota archaeon]